MDKETREFVEMKTKELINNPITCKEAKDMAEYWLKKENTKDEKKASKAYLKELEEDILPIEGLVDFSNSDYCLKAFGEKKAEEFKAHAKSLKESGAKYCDCPACKAALAIVNKKEDILK